jgi:hypothetical protein
VQPNPAWPGPNTTSLQEYRISNPALSRGRRPRPFIIRYSAFVFGLRQKQCHGVGIVAGLDGADELPSDGAHEADVVDVQNREHAESGTLPKS